MKTPNPKSGYIHSIESFGTLDGPGIRTIIFMAGCFLRCQFCHNVDMTDFSHAREYDTQDLIAQILKNKEYYESSGGGVTFSGGDPLFQPAFLKELLKECKKHKIHTTIDTSLHTPTPQTLKEIIPLTDLFMVSLKHMDDEIHKELTGQSNQTTINNLKKYFAKPSSPPLWLRLVILPGITDTPQNLKATAALAQTLNYEKFELLPYHELGLKKWKNYELSHIKPPTKKHVEKIAKFLQNQGVTNIISTLNS